MRTLRPRKASKVGQGYAPNHPTRDEQGHSDLGIQEQCMLAENLPGAITSPQSCVKSARGRDYPSSLHRGDTEAGEVANLRLGEWHSQGLMASP